MTTPAMSDAQLTDYSGEHLLHELSMLWELAEMLPNRKPGTETSAFVESFGIHLRNLIDFFYRQGRGDDVTAWDFMDTATTWTSTEPLSLTNAHRRASKELTHLTQERISGTPPEKEWDTLELRNEIGAIAKEFAAQANVNKLHPKVREFLQERPENMLVWIGNNVSHNNTAVSSPISVRGAASYRSVSSHTQIISKVDLKKL